MLIVSGFPGVGKSYLCKQNSNYIDLDSSSFSKITESGENNKLFPENYLNAIENYLNAIEEKYNSDSSKVVFISSHESVRSGLYCRYIKYFLIYPHYSLKEEYLHRYHLRGSPSEFINLINISWDIFLEEMENDPTKYKIELRSGQYVSDYLEFFI